MLYRVARDGKVGRVESLQAAGIYDLVVEEALVNWGVPIWVYDHQSWRCIIFTDGGARAVFHDLRHRPAAQVEKALALAAAFYERFRPAVLRALTAFAAAVILAQGERPAGTWDDARLNFYRWLYATGKLSDGE